MDRKQYVLSIQLGLPRKQVAPQVRGRHIFTRLAATTIVQNEAHT